MAKIQNVSMQAIMTGQHFDVGDNSLLIQITDKGASFPRVKAFTFKEIHQFDFHDLDHLTGGCLDECAIEDEQAARIAALLTYALANDMNVVVHCHAGICRSGAVAEVGIILGFEDAGGNTRIPNVLVKKKLMQALGLSYDEHAELRARYEQAAKDAEAGRIYF